MIEKKYRPSFAGFLLTFILLAFIQLKVEKVMLLAERFMKGSGWIEIILIALYGAFVIYKMHDPVNVPRWRKITWMIFSIVFFSQLIIGLSGFNKFLKMSTEQARNLYLIMTISLHSACISLSRI